MVLLKKFIRHNYVRCEHGYGLSRELDILRAEHGSAPTDHHRIFKHRT